MPGSTRTKQSEAAHTRTTRSPDTEESANRAKRRSTRGIVATEGPGLFDEDGASLTAREARLDELRHEYQAKLDRHVAWANERAERIAHPTRNDGESKEEWIERLTASGQAAQEKRERQRTENSAALEQLATRHAYPEQGEKLVSEAREIAEKAATIACARLTDTQIRKLEVILGKLRKFLREETAGENTMIIHWVQHAYSIIDQSITTSAWMMTMTESPTKQRELWVRNVAFLWHERTGKDCIASRNMLKGGKVLNRTPLVRFIRATLDDALPGLTEGEIFRGVQIARKLVAAGTKRWF